MIGIVDYNAGNIRSVEHALSSLGFDFIISKDPTDLRNTDRVIFPGVGDAHYAMDQLHLIGYDSFLKDCAASGKPIFGICLGSQIIFDYSDEGETPLLGLIPGKIRHMQHLLDEQGDADRSIKIPHMGWNNLTYSKPCPLFEGVPESHDFYFVHSYVIQPEDPAVVCAYAEYGSLKIPAAVQQGNIFATQFHPEKSGEYGLAILKNFCTMKF